MTRLRSTKRVTVMMIMIVMMILMMMMMMMTPREAKARGDDDMP
jgi:preprotein translocase subunit YajC